LEDTPRRVVALIVDDVSAERTLLAALTRDRGFEVVQAVDGATAVETAHALQPDLIVLDIGLPDRDGLSVLAHLRDEHPLVPVVMVSSVGNERQVEEALDLGAVNFVKKPIVSEEFRFVLDRIYRALEEEADHRKVLQLVSMRQTRLSFPGTPTTIPPIVAYLGREVRHHYPGYRIPLPDLKLALYEALANAVEHGNLEIDYEQKSAAMRRPGGLDALVRERLDDARYQNRKVHVDVRYRIDRVEYRVRDEGAGFDPRAYDPPRALADTTALHGRGLALIRHYMSKVGWNASGTEIRMLRRLSREPGEETPPVR
jgi:DNA-binding response OmpR family regulator